MVYGLRACLPTILLSSRDKAKINKKCDTPKGEHNQCSPDEWGKIKFIIDDGLRRSHRKL